MRCFRIDDSWSERQDSNLRPLSPERGAPTISKRKSPEATHVAERHRNDWFDAVWSSRAGPLRLNAAPIHSDINSRKQIDSESELVSVGPCEKYAMGFNGAV